MTELDIVVAYGLVRAIAIPATFSDFNLINGPCELCGWSVRDASGDIPAANTNSVTSPAAGALIISSPALNEGTFRVLWEVGLTGTVAAADANNFVLRHNSAPVLLSVNPGVVGAYPQPEVAIPVASGDTISVNANGVGTVGAVYTASISLQPIGITNAAAELQDGNNPLGEMGVPANAADTEWFGTPGLWVRNRLNYHPVSGLITGVVFVRYDKNTG